MGELKAYNPITAIAERHISYLYVSISILISTSLICMCYIDTKEKRGLQYEKTEKRLPSG